MRGRQRRIGDVLNPRRVALAGAAALALATGTGCGGQSEAERDAGAAVIARPVAPPQLGEATPEPGASLPPDAATPPDDATATPARGRARPRPGAILSAADQASFDRLARSLGGESGVAVSGVGVGRRVERAGSLKSAVAWSTAKVPIAMAVIDAGRATSSQADLTAAITASDNAAATRLWSSLGTPQAAADAATAELRSGGDQHTTIESRALRGAGYTPFGQTVWSLVDQARFTAQLPCSGAGGQVLALMGDVIPSQRWGLGATGAAAQLKGGWGPGTQPGVAGGYLDRQLGVMTIAGKPLAVTVANRPADGSHQTGTRNLSAIARWLAGHASVSAQPSAPAC
jgi:hypothetical protein